MFRSTLKRLVRLGGFALTSRGHAGVRFLDHPPRSAFDLVLLHCYPTVADLNFIQVGANDGQLADPLERYIESCGWSGLMFEPLPASFAALQRRHGKNPRLRLRPSAIDKTTSRRPIYDLNRKAHPGLPDWANGLASFSRERILQAARELGLDEGAIVAEEITTTNWEDVWRDFGSQRCDLLALDTEGHDLTLLRAADLARHRPRIIHFEHACAQADDRLALYRELLDLGYELATDGPDTTAWLKQ